MHARGTFKRRLPWEPSPNRLRLELSPATGYSLTLVGVIGQETARETRPVWRGRPLDELAPLATVALGLILGAISVGIYMAAGYSKAMLWLWLGALVITAVGFGLRSRTWPRIGVVDLVCAAGAAALCAPFYLIELYRWPVQVSSDEAALMDTAKQYATIHVPDPLGAGFYLTRPALLFIVWGKLGNALGGVDLFHIRLLHALVGLLAVAATYVLFRLLMPRGWAFIGSLVVGFSHSMFMISRLAMRENTAVLLLVVALALLLWGLRENHELATFLGGVVAGLGFYVYYPARIAFPIWVVFLIAAGLVYRKKFAPKRLALLGAVAAAGVLLTALPISYSESQVPAAERSGQTDGLLIYNTARETQKDWVFAHSQLSGYLTNVKYGLTTFNNTVVDHGWIYVNPGHGFVDPLTGILLWLGVGVVAIGLIRRRREDEGALLMLVGFLVLWLSFAFAVNKAPNYTRLLVTLPFVAFFVVESLRWLVDRWRSTRYGPPVLVGAFVAALVVWNLSIGWDFIQQGRREGDPIGSTGRYVRAHENVPGQKYFVATSDVRPYYVWGNDTASLERISLFAPKVAPQVVDPLALQQFSAAPPFALLMRREVWQPAAAQLAARYPRGRIRNVSPDGARVVFEVPS
jgi:Dolichyl-phosphate-mannose-protein mannosyltransferase